jgi:Zn-dependent peptidase ImmA (M78 family)/DNA-binding XRE family transcriptional regulator
MFNPERLKLARERRKLTQKAFALALGWDPKTINRYESGEVEPAPPYIVAMAEYLAFPVNFFLGADVDPPVEDAISFRALRAMPARDRHAAIAAGAFAFMVSDWVERRFELPVADVPEFKESGDPETAARMVRELWLLGEKPIRNVVHLLEAKGVRVFSLREEAECVDAFSTWRRNVPFIYLSSAKTAERSRFDAAHELGHLVLHRHGGPQGGRVAEDQANRFASAFLMSRADVLARLPRVHTLSQIVEGKRRWGVSVAALNYRLHQLGVTSDWQFRTFCIQINERFRRLEPHAMARETSQVWEKVFGELRGEGVGKHTIARDLALPVVEVENLVFRLTNMQSIDGAAASSSGKSRAKLTLVPPTEETILERAAAER